MAERNSASTSGTPNKFSCVRKVHTSVSFFVVPGFRVSPERGGFGSRHGAGGHGLRRIVPGLTTLVGYHGCGVLSSERCKGPNLVAQASSRQCSRQDGGAPNRTARGGATPKLEQPWANRPLTSSAVIDGLGRRLPY